MMDEQNKAKVFDDQTYKEEFDNYKKQFETIVSSYEITLLLSTFMGKSVKSFTPTVKTKDGRPGQYNDVIYWYRITINDEYLKPSYNNENTKVKAIHIMPYCITNEDVNNSNLKLSNRNEHPFRNQDKYFVDFDGENCCSGFNFHKYTDKTKTRYQVVLVNEGTSPAGPGCREYIYPECFLEKEDRMQYIKNDWYFPQLNSEKVYFNDDENLKKDLIESLKKSFKAIFEETHFVDKLEEYNKKVKMINK